MVREQNFPVKASKERAPLISVIVPVYNTQAYLRRCVESICHQTYSRLEIILVDDGSKDDSAAICADLAGQDRRIRTIYQQHGGVARARNKGVELAAGEYIAFVDSDDVIAPAMIEELLDALLSAAADVSICDLHPVTSGGTYRKAYKSNRNKSDLRYTGIQAMKVMLYQKRFETGPCGKLYKRSIVQAHPFPPGRFFEDLFTMYRVLYDAKAVAYRPRKLYYYVDNPQSAMNRAFHIGVLDELEAADEILRFVETQCPQCASAARARKYSAYCQVFRWMNRTELDTDIARISQEIWAYLLQTRWAIIKDKDVRWKNRCAALCTLLGKRVFLWI